MEYNTYCMNNVSKVFYIFGLFWLIDRTAEDLVRKQDRREWE